MPVNAVLVLCPTSTSPGLPERVSINAAPYLLAGGGDILLDLALNTGGTGWEFEAGDLLGESTPGADLRAVITSWDTHLSRLGVHGGVHAVTGLVVDPTAMAGWVLTHQWAAVHAMTLMALVRSLSVTLSGSTAAEVVTDRLRQPAYQEHLILDALRLDADAPPPAQVDLMINSIARTVLAYWDGLVATFDAAPRSEDRAALVEDMTVGVEANLGLILYMVGISAREPLMGFTRAAAYQSSGVDPVTARSLDHSVSTI